MIETRCTCCGQQVAFTPDWTLWPWPDGAWLCESCNDDRHAVEEYDGPPVTYPAGNQWLAGKLHQHPSPPEQAPSTTGRFDRAVHRHRCRAANRK